MKRIQLKWAAGGDSAWLGNPYYVSSTSERLALSEKECALFSENIPSAAAIAHLESMDIDDEPYQSRGEYLFALACIRCAFPDQMERMIPKKYNIGTALTRAADPQMIEYLANGGRWRVQNAIDRKELAPGSCGNEGAHFELKAWGRNVRSQLKYRAKLILMFFKISLFFQISPSDRGRAADYMFDVLTKLEFPLISKGLPPVTRLRRGATRDALRRKQSKVIREPKQKRILLQKPAAETARIRSVAMQVPKKPVRGTYFDQFLLVV